MSWIIRHNGMTFNTDDFLIADLEQIESATGEPWSLSNPYRNVKVARAFLAAALLRDGRSAGEVESGLRLITLKSLKKTFEFVPDTEDDEEIDAEADPSQSPSSTSPESSVTPSEMASRRASRAKSA